MCDSIINKEEVLYDLTKVSKSTLELILPLFDYVKSDIVARSIKMLDKPQFVFYLNWVMATIEILKDYLRGWAQAIEWEKISLITRQVLDKPKEDKKPWKVRKI